MRHPVFEKAAKPATLVKQSNHVLRPCRFSGDWSLGELVSWGTRLPGDWYPGDWSPGIGLLGTGPRGTRFATRHLLPWPLTPVT